MIRYIGYVDQNTMGITTALIASFDTEKLNVDDRKAQEIYEKTKKGTNYHLESMILDKIFFIIDNDAVVATGDEDERYDLSLKEGEDWPIACHAASYKTLKNAIESVVRYKKIIFTSIFWRDN